MDGYFPVTLQVPFSEGVGTYRSYLSVAFGHYVRAKLMLHEGLSLPADTPTTHPHIDKKSQGWVLMLDHTFNWFDVSYMLIDFRNHYAERFNEAAPGSWERHILEGYTNTVLYQLVGGLHQLGEIWERLGSDLAELGMSTVIDHHRSQNATFAMYTRARHTLEHIKNRYPGQSGGDLLTRSIDPTSFRWGMEETRSGVFRYSDSKGKTTLHLTHKKLMGIKNAHVAMIHQLQREIDEFPKTLIGSDSG